MFGIGDIVVYGAQGICKIECTENKMIGRQKVEYYVLKPLFNENTAVFVPIENETLIAKMKPVLTTDEAYALIKKSAKLDALKYADENQKREAYKIILASGDREKLISLIKTIRLERETRRVVGKKLNLSDEQSLRKAELLIYNELAFVLNKSQQEIENII